MTLSTLGSELWWTHLAVTVRAEMLRVFPPGTCVLATRLGLNVAEYFGVRATPEAVTVTAFGTTAFALFQAGKPVPADLAPVGIDGQGTLRPRPGRMTLWDGHLLLRTDTEPRLVDVSADQLHRPQRGINVPVPVVTPVFDLQPWQQGHTVTFTHDDTVLMYTRIDNMAWRRASDWTRAPRDAVTRAIVATTIRRMRESTI